MVDTTEEIKTESSEEDLQRLEKALDFSNTMKTFNLNKNNLKGKNRKILMDAMLVTIAGIAAAMKNTG